MACRHLSLSTNNIEKISSLTGMENLKILSLGRNCIKKIENLDGIADTLEELWISYNSIEKLVGIDKLSNLKVLYMANNKVKDWAEVDRLSALEKLEDLLLRACPIYDEHKDAGTISTYRVEVWHQGTAAVASVCQGRLHGVSTHMTRPRQVSRCQSHGTSQDPIATLLKRTGRLLQA